LILNADDKFLYGHRMTDIPHRVVNVSQADTGVVYHKNWKLEVGLKRCEVAKPVKVSDYRKQQAWIDIAHVASNLRHRTNMPGNVLPGAVLGQAINTLTAEAKSSTVFTRLGLMVGVTEASEEEIERATRIEKVQKEAAEQKQVEKKKQNRLILVLVLIIVGALVVAPFALCFLCSLTSYFSMLVDVAGM
jgi:hypothetical protein